MFFVYFLKKPKSCHIYIGFTNDLRRRMREHEKDKPEYKLAYYEAYFSEKDARERERKLKQYGTTLGHLKKRLSNTLIEI